MMEPEISRLKVQCQQLLAGVIPRLFYMHVGTEWNGTMSLKEKGDVIKREPRFGTMSLREKGDVTKREPRFGFSIPMFQCKAKEA